MELGTASILVQLLLIFVLVALFAGRRRIRLHRERRDTTPGAATPAATPWPSMRSAAPAVPPAPVLVELPVAMRRAPVQGVSSRVSEELLPPCFADTCADWAQVDPVPGKVPGQVPDTRFSLADWSAPTDRVALDSALDSAGLDWALEARVESPRATRPVPVRTGGAPMSCTIAPQVHQCA